MQVIIKNMKWHRLLAVLALAGGCHAPAQPPLKSTACVCAPHGPCAGFFSTCWRQWPSQCPMCPPQMEPTDIMPAMPASGEPIPAPAPRPPELPRDPLLEQPGEIAPPPSDFHSEVPFEPDENQGARRATAVPPALARQGAASVPRPEKTISPQPTIGFRQPSGDAPSPGVMWLSYPSR